MTPHLEQRLAEIAEREGYNWPAGEIAHAMRLGAEAALDSKWTPIDENTPTEELHIRGLWVFDPSGNPIVFECHVGVVDDDFDFVDGYGNSHGWMAGDYEFWQPIDAPQPAEYKGAAR